MGELSELFVREALAPLGEGRNLAQAERIDEAIAAVRHEELLRRLRAGVDQVAKATGRESLQVFRQLPMPAIEDELRELETRQRAALDAWRAHVDAHGRPSSGLAKESASVIAALRDVALGIRDDPATSNALGALSEALDRWRQTVDGCRATLDASTDLMRARQWRRFRRFAVVAALGGALVGVGGLLLKRHQTRARIDAAIAAGGCDVEASIASDDLERATAAQRDAIQAAEQRCEQEALERERQAEAAEKAEAERLEAEREAAAKRQACEAVGRAFAGGSLADVDQQLLGGERARLERIAEGKLTLDDIRTDFALPCAETDTGEGLRLVLAQRVVEAMPTWIQIAVPSPLVRRALVEHKDVLPASDLALMAGHIDVMAERAVKTGLADDVQHFEVLCRLAADLVQPTKSNCAAVLELAGARRDV